MANFFDQFDAGPAAPAAPPPGQAGANFFDQFDGSRSGIEPPPPSAPASRGQSVFNSIYGNVIQGAEQRASPHPEQYGEPIATGADVFQNDAGEMSFRDKSGNVVPTDAKKHVVLTGPEGSPVVYARSPETSESPIVGASRVLTLGLGSSVPSTGPALAARGALEATVPELKGAATAVYNDPAILSRPVTPQMVGTAFRQVAPQLRTFPSNVRDQVVSSLADLRSPSGLTINDLDNASQRLGHLADETQMTAAGPKATPTAAAATIVKKQVDGLMRQLAPEFVPADANYSAAKAAETISGREGKAQVLSRGGDFAGRMQTQATQLLANPKYLRGFKPDEIEQLRQISEGTMKGEALRELNARLGGKISGAIVGGIVGGASAGPLGAIAGMAVGAPTEAVIGKVLTGLGNRLTAGQVDTLSRSVRARSPLGQEIAQRTADWQKAFDEVKAAPSMAKLQTLASTARSLSVSLGSAGVKVRPTELLQMPAGRTEDNQQ